MAERTRSVLIATLCGHEYVWMFKTPRPYCQGCVRDMRRRINQENEERRRLDAARIRTARPSIPRSVRLFVYERDEWTCQLCMEPVDQSLMTLDPHNDWAPSLDHIICRSWTEQQDHTPRNLRLAHRWCNSVRGDERRWTAADLLPSA